MWRQERIARNLFSTTGYTSLEQLRTAIDRAGSTARQARRILAEEQVEIAIHTPELIRGALVKQPEFLNQHEAGTSSGSSIYAPKQKAVAEASYLNLGFDRYAALNHRIKPKFGFLRAAPETGVAPMSHYGYGTDVFVFKLSAVRERLTITPGGSYINFRGNSHFQVKIDGLFQDPEIPKKAFVNYGTISSYPGPFGKQSSLGFLADYGKGISWLWTALSRRLN